MASMQSSDPARAGEDAVPGAPPHYWRQVDGAATVGEGLTASYKTDHTLMYTSEILLLAISQSG